jgi:hypothetical protein
MSVRLTVRNPLNNKWLDQCSSEYYFRDSNNNNWIRFLPEQTSVRDSGNNEWLSVDCKFDPELDDPCANLALLSSANCPSLISIEEAGSGDGQGSGGQGFDIIQGYPVGYDLPDAGLVGFGVEVLQGSFENKVISRPGIDFQKESYGSEAINTFYGKGTYSNPSYLYTHTMSNGSAITETIYEIGQSRGIFEILYASYNARGISIDVYYLGALFASTCGRVTGRGKLEFGLDAAIGAGEDRIMVRVRGEEDNRWLFNIHGPKASIGLAAFEPGNISHLSLIRKTEYIGTPLFPAPAHSRVYPFENRTPDGQYWYEYTHEIGLLDPAIGPHILHLNYETWNTEDWVEVYHGSKRVASTFEYKSEDGLLAIVFDAYRFKTPVPDIVVKVMSQERARGGDILTQEYMLFDSNTPGYKENRWLCETPNNGITSAGHYSTEDHFQMNADQTEGVASIKIVGLNPQMTYNASVFDKVGNLIQALQGNGTQFLSWFKLPSDPNYENLNEISIRIDAPLDTGWTYEVGCYISVLSIRLEDKEVPACPSQDDISITISDTLVSEGSQAKFRVSTNYPVLEAITLDYVTQDITASSVAGESSDANPYPLYRSFNGEISGAVYKDEEFNYTLLVESDASRLYGPVSTGTYDNYFDQDKNNFRAINQSHLGVNSFGALSTYFKMLVNMIQDRLGPLTSSHSLLLLTHQRFITFEGWDDGTSQAEDSGFDSEYVIHMDTVMDHMVRSIKSIYGITVDVKYYNDYGLSHNDEIVSSNQTFSSHRTILSNYDIIVSDPYHVWQHHRDENTDITTYADLENKVFVQERSTVFATALSRAVKQSGTPTVIIAIAGNTKSRYNQGPVKTGSINTKDIINALGVKGSIDVENDIITFSTEPGDISVEAITDINGTSNFLFENIDPFDAITNQFNARSFTKLSLSNVAADGTVGGSPGTTVDYQSKSGTVTIPLGSSGVDINVNTYSDTISDPREQFNVIISNPSSGIIENDTGIATIVEGVAPPGGNDIQTVYTGDIIGKGRGASGFTSFNYCDILVGFVINSNNANMEFPTENGSLQVEGVTNPVESAGSIAVTFSSSNSHNITDLTLANTAFHTEVLLATFDFDPSRTYSYRWNVTQVANTITGYILANNIHNYTSYLEANSTSPVFAGNHGTYSEDNTQLSIQMDQTFANSSMNGTLSASVEIFVIDDTGFEQKSDPITVTLDVTSTATSTSFGGGGGCISVDTPIYYEDGTTKTAINLKPGDRIIGYTVPGMVDENTPGWKDWTTNTIEGGQEQVVTVRSATHDWYREYYIINSDLHITKDHALFVKTNTTWSWKDVNDMVIGDKLLGRDGKEVYVGTLTKVLDPIDVIVLDVEEIDTYFVGNRGVLVHNAPTQKF